MRSLAAGHLPGHDGAEYIKTPPRRKGEKRKILINAFRQLNVFRQLELHADKRGEAVEERRHLKAQQPHGILSLSAFLKFRRPLVFFPSNVIKYTCFSIGVVCPETESEVQNGNIKHNGKLLH